jgi:hypothetical protein
MPAPRSTRVVIVCNEEVAAMAGSWPRPTPSPGATGPRSGENRKASPPPGSARRHDRITGGGGGGGKPLVAPAFHRSTLSARSAP